MDSPLGGTLKIKAYAGTGKTSSLVAKAHHEAAEHGSRGLYVAFNKSAQIEAQQRFGRSAICKTCHALAYPRFGAKYQDNTRSMRPLDVVQLSGLVDNYRDAKALLNAVHFYCISGATEFPGSPSSRLDQEARDLWAMMCDPSHPVPMSHDGYLKLFQLSNPRLPGDYLMLDEFQDTNPVMLEIVRAQTQPVIVVGDPYQSIYAFRGATNAMREFQSRRSLSLTSSWRFGPAVAKIANALLHGVYSESEPVVGLGPETIINPYPEPAGQIHTITRTNAKLFDRAAMALDSRFSIGFIGGVEGYNFHRVCDVRHIQNGQPDQVVDPFLKNFRSNAEFSAYVKDVEDPELLMLERVCRERGDSVFQQVERIHSCCIGATEAQRVFVNAHKSKGLSLEHVVLADDFKPLLDKDGESLLESLDAQEVNLLYVAATRAIKSLRICSPLQAYLGWYERFGQYRVC